MKHLLLPLLLLAGISSVQAQDPANIETRHKDHVIILPDSTRDLIEQLQHMPNIEVGKGITFRPRNNRYEVTMRFRMQNLLAMNFDDG